MSSVDEGSTHELPESLFAGLADGNDVFGNGDEVIRVRAGPRSRCLSSQPSLWCAGRVERCEPGGPAVVLYRAAWIERGRQIDAVFADHPSLCDPIGANTHLRTRCGKRAGCGPEQARRRVSVP